MKSHYQHDNPFPLKRYYILYAGTGVVLFYALFFAFFVRAERQVLYDQHIAHLTDKAHILYRDISRDILRSRSISWDDMAGNDLHRRQLRDEIAPLIQMDFNMDMIKLLSRDGIVLYDHANSANEGKPYDSMHEPGFQTALQGQTAAQVEHEPNGRFMEVYLPILDRNETAVVAVLEVYENVGRFEKQVYAALNKIILVPTMIFALLQFILFLIIAKADTVIAEKTNLLVTIRRNMEKYLSSSATRAIYEAVTMRKELFRGERQQVVVFFSDIRGFTRYSEDNEPETVVRELNAMFDLQAGVIHRRGGVIDKFIGDEIMALFPPDKAVDAVQAGLEILEQINRQPALSFEIGIGVHVGDALVGSIGTSDRRDYTAMGDTINTGARLCGVSAPGEILISGSLYRTLPLEIRERFGTGKQLTLKGKSEPFEAYACRPA